MVEDSCCPDSASSTIVMSSHACHGTKVGGRKGGRKGKDRENIYATVRTTSLKIKEKHFFFFTSTDAKELVMEPVLPNTCL